MMVDADRARLGAVGERLKQIGQLGVAMFFHEPRHVVRPATGARLAGPYDVIFRSRRIFAPHLGEPRGLSVSGATSIP